MRLAALARNFDASLTLFADALLRPDFDDGEWRRVHELHLAALVREQDDPQAVARKVSLRAFFGDEHPYGRPPSGTPTGVEAIKRGDVVNFYADHFGPRRAVLLVAGDLTREDAEAALEGAFGTCLRSPNADPAVLVEKTDWHDDATSRMAEAMETLDDRSRDILQSRWLTEDKQTLHELADVYGVSAERIRQIEATAIKKLGVAMEV